MSSSARFWQFAPALGLFLLLFTPFLALLTAHDREADQGGLPAGVKNTQNPNENPIPPEEAVKKITTPDGFRVTLFAGEPNVAQPIAITFDDRGRLWVAECYTYKEWDKTSLDRILIFTDTNGDGVFDERKIFASGLTNLSSIEVGFGGVWACCAPQLLFFPDRDGDDRPDDKPEVILDGFNHGKVGHNIVNGLKWGPDGWLYGCHGIQGESIVGPPGAADEDRVRLNCCIWRIHPTDKRFEVVCEGTTNPWGLDFDDHGEAFFINCVIGHFWHAVPGAFYKRMYGQHYRQHLYELIDACSDHLHFAGKEWTASRGGHGKHDELGGGHAHCGLAIYLGDNFPPEYRNTAFMGNLHGNRINHDLPARSGSGYVAKHGADFLFANDEWFRTVAIACGPDGGMFITDWCDYGECHDNDGVHRTSGRIYKVIHKGSDGKTQKPRTDLALSKLPDAELVELQLHANDWFVRQARRLLQERAAAGKDMAAVHAALRQMFAEQKDATRKLRALWALQVTGGADESFLLEQAKHENEHVRSWAIRLLGERGEYSTAAIAQLENLAREDESGLVRTYVASALRLLPHEARWPIARALATREDEASDTNLQLLVWYGIEPAVPQQKAQALALAAATKWPKLRTFIARRVAGGSQ